MAEAHVELETHRLKSRVLFWAFLVMLCSTIIMGFELKKRDSVAKQLQEKLIKTPADVLARLQVTPSDVIRKLEVTPSDVRKEVQALREELLEEIRKIKRQP